MIEDPGKLAGTRHEPRTRATRTTATAIFRALALILLGALLPAQAETLFASVSVPLAKSWPDLTARITRSLESAGFDVRLMILPDKRSLFSVRQGRVALEYLRMPVDRASNPQLLTLKPVLLTEEYRMLTGRNKVENCIAPEARYKKMSMAGVVGMNVHSDYYAPRFRRSVALPGVFTAVGQVARQRADVTFLPDWAINQLPAKLANKVAVCPGVHKAFRYYAHLHNDFVQARGKIEAALRAEFGAD